MPESAVRARRWRVRRAVDRYRRPLAAGLAGLAAAVALMVLRTDAPDEVSTAPASTAPRPGDVVIPVPLDSGAIASALTIGDTIDLVSVEADGHPRVVAPRARVVDLTASASALSAASAVILVAVPESDALPLSAAAASGPLSVVIRPG